MADQRKFSLGKEPFIRKADNNQNTTTIMRDFTIALIPLILFGWIKNGLLPFINGDTSSILNMFYPLILVFIGGFTSWLLEYIHFQFIRKEKNVFKSLRESYPIIPGLILGMIVSVNTPLWILILGCFFATVAGKLIFGGFGRNIFNPALVGYVFINMAYAGVIVQRGGALNASELVALEAVAGATPLANFSVNPIASPELLIAPYGNLWNFFIGTMPGMLAETSAMLCVVAFVWLVVRKVINWRIPVIYVLTVFVLTYLIGAFHGYAADLRYALFGVLSGGLLFGAVFMATEPVTSPKSPNGKVIYALFLAVLTVLFRFKSNLPEGVGTAIMTMNLFTVMIDRMATKMRVTTQKRKLVTTYGLIALLLVGISSYTVSTTFAKEEIEEETTVELVSSYQDFYTFDFVYEFLVDEVDKVFVVVNQDYEIISVNVAFYDNEEFRDMFDAIVFQNKQNAMISSVMETAGIYEIVVHSKGYKSTIVTTVTLDALFNIQQVVIDDSEESYDAAQNDEWNGVHPKDVLPASIIANQNDLSQVEAIAGATVTRNAILAGVTLVQDYVRVVLKGEILDENADLVFRSYAQDYATLQFAYTFAFGRNQVIVYTNASYEIVSMNNTFFDTDSFRTIFTQAINANKIVNYIEEVTEEAGIYTIVAKAFGYKSHVSVTIVLDASYNFASVTINTSGESYSDTHNDEWTGELPSQVMPGRILAEQEDLNAIEGIAGATITVNAILVAVKQVQDYVSEVLTNE